MIPVGNQLLYSQPLFLQANQEAIPELKYVILASSDKVQMAPTLELALQGLLVGGPTVVCASRADTCDPTPTPHADAGGHPVAGRPRPRRRETKTASAGGAAEP